ncbi:MAG: hypothetical protein L0H25_01615 [Micrococcales bacterium]|nr:hypothetical protein [Micrococcales bacterium]
MDPSPGTSPDTPNTPDTPDGVGEILVCATCGRTPDPSEADAARLTWSRGLEADQTRWTCAACSRANLRSIEGRLDQEWW